MGYVLGINCAYHELSAALTKDGNLVACIEKERLSRIKHGKSALVSNPDVLPIRAIEYCLKQAGISFYDIAQIGTSIRPDDRLLNVGSDKKVVDGDWGSEKGENLFIEKIKSVPGLLDAHFGTCGTADRFHWIQHHVTHAASAFLVGPYEEAAIVCVDGIGEYASTWIGHGKGVDMKVLKEIDYPNSLGFLWEKMSKFMGFSEYDACKVMGLASYGNPDVFKDEFGQIVQLGPDGSFFVDNDIMAFRVESYGKLEDLFGTKRIPSPAHLSTVHENIAAGLQAITNQVLLHICKYAAEMTGSRNLCLAGGVVLNCVANTEILRSGLFGSIFIQPAAHDGGTALGAAFYIWNTLQAHPRTYKMKDAYTGPEFSDAEVEEVLRRKGLVYERLPDIERRTAELLAEGDNIIGWFQGKMEWGPRALGNRTLLTDPRNGDMREVLNIRIKKREPFRPFAPSVLQEFVEEWFEVPKEAESESKEYMIFTFPVNKDKVGRIPAVTHVDNTSRVQVVKRGTNPRYHKLISEFHRLTGIPMVLNTSFNDNEPIVCDPMDAIRTFKRTRMDYLVIHNFLIRGTNPSIE